MICQEPMIGSQPPARYYWLAALVSRCAEIFSHIGIENMSSHATSPQLFWSVLTGGAWSEEKLENCQSRYCGFSPLKGQGSKQLSKQMQPGPETKHTIWTHHTAGPGLNPPNENKSSGIIRAALFQQNWSKLPVALSCKSKNCSATVERFSVWPLENNDSCSLTLKGAPREM